MWEAAIPALGSLAMNYFGNQASAKSKGYDSALSPEQRQLWSQILMPEVTSRYARGGKFTDAERNMYLGDILGGVEQGYQQNLDSLNKLNLDPNTRRALGFSLQRGKSMGKAAGYRQLVDMEKQNFDNSINLASGLGTANLGTRNTVNPNKYAQGELFGDLGNILGNVGGDMSTFKGDPTTGKSNMSQYLTSRGWNW